MREVFWTEFLLRYRQKEKEQHREEINMRGYYVGSGYYGLVDGRYLLFASESDYFEAMEEEAA